MAWFFTRLRRTPDDKSLGQRGEDVAVRYLRRQGYKIVLRNFRCALGEIDIVARDGPCLVFVEVKTRQSPDEAPEDQVGPAKQHQLTKAARFYLQRYGDGVPPARIDVVAVVWPESGRPVVRHLISAFEATF